MSDPGLFPTHRPRVSGVCRIPFKLTCAHCGNVCFDVYMVKPEIWRETNLPRHGGWFLHLTCLETVLGRSLTINDFDPSVKANDSILFGFRMGLRDSK